MTVGACKTHRLGYEVAALGAKAQAARLPPLEPDPALGARVPGVRPALRRPLPRRRASPGPGRGLSGPHLCPRVHSAPRAEGCLRPLTAPLCRRRPGRPSGDLRCLPPEPPSRPRSEDAPGTPPAGCPRRGQAAPGPQPLRANRGARREGPLPLPPRNHPLPQAPRARGDWFPLRAESGFFTHPEHPRFSASQENKTNRIFLASLGSCAVRHNLSLRGHCDQIIWDCFMKVQIKKETVPRSVLGGYIFKDFRGQF